MSRRILIVDDNSEIHEDIKKILYNADDTSELDELELEVLGTTIEKSPHMSMTIDTALQGEQGVQMGFKAWEEGNPYALAFIDVRMPPGLDGIQTIKKIREFDKDLQFVIITAYSDYSWNEINSAIDSQGNLLILKKPFDFIEIRQLASALTNKWMISRENRKKSKDLEKVNQVLQAEIEERRKLEIEHKRLLQNLNDRIKELDCICELNKLFQKPELALDEIFSRFIHMIPSAFEQSEETCARIEYNGKEFVTDKFSGSRWKLDAPIQCHGKAIGAIEVFLTIKDSEEPNQTSFKEKQTLLDVLSEQIGKTIERLQAEEEKQVFQTQLRQVQKMEAIGTLAGGIAHDFNNILVPIVGYTEMLLQDIPDDNPLQESLNNIYSAASRAKNLVKQILSFSRQEIGEVKRIKIEPIEEGSMFPL